MKTNCACLNNVADWTSVKKFYPTAEECRINNSVTCTEIGCQKVFRSESNLQLHLVKTHKKNSFSKKCLKLYHCPVEECCYNKCKFFGNMKSLRQHYLKVHVEKQFKCGKCQAGFSATKYLNIHEPFCGVQFKCCDCGTHYPSYESLRTHGRRKNHRILSKESYKPDGDCDGDLLSSTIKSDQKTVLFKHKKYPSVVSTSDCGFVAILPKPPSKSTRNEECQTNQTKPPNVSHKTTQVGCDLSDPPKSDQFSVTTQTLLPIEEMCLQKNSNTQTESITLKTTSCNTSFELNDFVLSGTYSSATQTNSDNLSNFHSETQTDFLFDEDMFSCDYLMSNMCTQTCDDIFNQFGFSNIQTQTMFNDVLVSVESQTNMSQLVKSSDLKDFTHTETQTDAEFNQMLEVINS